MAADSAARRLLLSCTGAGSTQSSVQKQQDPTKDLADEIRALLKQNYRSDFPRQIEGTWQYIGSTWQQTVQPGDCNSPAQEQEQHRVQSKKQQDPTKDLADKIRALLKQRHRSDSPRHIEGT